MKAGERKGIFLGISLTVSTYSSTLVIRDTRIYSNCIYYFCPLVVIKRVLVILFYFLPSACAIGFGAKMGRTFDFSFICNNSWKGKKGKKKRKEKKRKKKTDTKKRK